MEVRFQYFDSCPKWQTTHDRLVQVVAGRSDVDLVMQRVETAEEAAAAGFLGSPTVLVDGVDAFGADVAAPLGTLACRVYQTDDGSPTLDQLRSALGSPPAHLSLGDMLRRVPGEPTELYPDGVPFAVGMEHGTMSVELFAPRGDDRQSPHDQDELYFVVEGSAVFLLDGEPMPCVTGDVLFVPAGMPHHFADMTEDFATWVVFWGPSGGESGD